jgi:hypothetical protein
VWAPLRQTAKPKRETKAAEQSTAALHTKPPEQKTKTKAAEQSSAARQTKR